MNEIAVKLRDAALTLENDGEFYSKYKATYNGNAARARNLIKRYLAANGCPFARDLRSDMEYREHLRRYFDDVWALPGCPVNGMEVPVFEFWKDDVCYPKEPAGPKPGSMFDVSYAKAPGSNDREKWAMYGRPWVTKDENTLFKLFWEGKDLRQMCEALERPPNGIVSRLVHIRCLRLDSNGYKYRVCKRPQDVPQPLPEVVALEREIDDHIAAAAEHLSNVSNSLKEIIMSKTTEIIKIETKTFVNGVDISTMEDSAIYQLIATQEAEIEKLDKIKNKPKKLKDEITKRQDGITALVAYLDSKGE